MNKKLIIFNSLSEFALLATNVVVSFILTPIIVHTLGNQQYGIWELLVGLVGYLGLLELGAGPAVLRYVADAWSREDRVALNHVFNTGLFALFGVGFLGFTVILIVAIWPEYILGLNAMQSQELAPVFIVFALNLGVSLPSSAVSAYVLGMQLNRYYNLLRIFITVISALAVYYVLVSGWHPALIWMGLIGLIGTVVQSSLVTLWIILVDRRVVMSFSYFSVATFKELLGYGAKSTVLMASVSTMRRLVSFVIAHTAGVAQVVFFVIPNRLVEYSHALGIALGYPLTPVFADLAGKGDRDKVRQTWFKTSHALQVVTLGMPVMLAGLGDSFINIWMGQEYSEGGKYILYLLCAGLFAEGITPNGNRLLQSLGKHGKLALLLAILAPVYFVLSFVLGRLWGVEGVAMGVTLFAVTVGILEMTLACSAIGISWLDHIIATFRRFTIPIVATLGVFVFLNGISEPAGYSDFIIYAIPPCLTYLVCVWFVVFDASERKGLVGLIKGSRI